MSSIQPFTGLDVATASLRHLIDQGLVRDFTMDVREDGVQIRLVPADAAVRTLKTAHYFKLPFELRLTWTQRAGERTRAIELRVQARHERALATAERVQRRKAWIESVLLADSRRTVERV